MLNERSERYVVRASQAVPILMLITFLAPGHGDARFLSLTLNPPQAQLITFLSFILTAAGVVGFAVVMLGKIDIARAETYTRIYTAVITLFALMEALIYLSGPASDSILNVVMCITSSAIILGLGATAISERSENVLFALVKRISAKGRGRHDPGSRAADME